MLGILKNFSYLCMFLNKYVCAYTRMKETTDTIKHIATVTGIDGNILHVKMLQGSACSSCHAAKMCQSSEVKEKEVDVVCDEISKYRVGQKVLLVGSIHQGLKATLWAYVLPILVLLVVMFTCYMARLSDTVSAVASLGAVAMYFLGIYFYRGRFQRQFSFSVRDSLSE